MRVEREVKKRASEQGRKKGENFHEKAQPKIDWKNVDQEEEV